MRRASWPCRWATTWPRTWAWTSRFSPGACTVIACLPNSMARTFGSTTAASKKPRRRFPNEAKSTSTTLRRDIGTAIEHLYGPKEQSLQRLAATFRRGDLIEVLTPLSDFRRPLIRALSRGVGFVHSCRMQRPRSAMRRGAGGPPPWAARLRAPFSALAWTPYVPFFNWYSANITLAATSPSAWCRSSSNATAGPVHAG